MPGICQYPPYSAPVVRIHLAVIVYETLTEANFLYSFSCQTGNEYFLYIVFNDRQENSHLRQVAIHHPLSISQPGIYYSQIQLICIYL